ncbi:hypothetical protein N7462_004116 [Penicillium macrosclerotiorum]|uniref:uncharacterized protein n=1 Tax=Penicillium macrosclerotiorum TaxID=303699 RepID=UPI002547FF30|nr:uncharacterized protein N7462_004116 [Penicillium macrosclerotiorum]KAJ5689724.1 hypothetical protein N7462_004116 [Penicillium macrosclerotiorum]
MPGAGDDGQWPGYWKVGGEMERRAETRAHGQAPGAFDTPRLIAGGLRQESPPQAKLRASAELSTSLLHLFLSLLPAQAFLLSEFNIQCSTQSLQLSDLNFGTFLFYPATFPLNATPVALSQDANLVKGQTAQSPGTSCFLSQSPMVLLITSLTSRIQNIIPS